MFVSLPLSCLLISTITKQSSSIWKHVNCLCSSLRLSTQSFSRPLTSYFIAHRPWHSICRVQVQVQENFYSRCFMWAIIEWNVTAVKHPSVKNVLRTLTCVDKWSANVINSKSIDPGDCFETAICKPLSGKFKKKTNYFFFIFTSNHWQFIISYSNSLDCTNMSWSKSIKVLWHRTTYHCLGKYEYKTRYTRYTRFLSYSLNCFLYVNDAILSA